MIMKSIALVRAIGYFPSLKAVYQDAKYAALMVFVSTSVLCFAQEHRSKALTQVGRLKFEIFLQEKDVNTNYAHLKQTEEEIYDALQGLISLLNMRDSTQQLSIHTEEFMKRMALMHKPFESLSDFLAGLDRQLKSDLGSEYRVSLEDGSGDMYRTAYTDIADAVKSIQSMIIHFDEVFTEYEGSQEKLQKFEKELSHEIAKEKDAPAVRTEL